MDVLNNSPKIFPVLLASASQAEEKPAAAYLERIEIAAGYPLRHGTPPTCGKGLPGPPT